MIGTENFDLPAKPASVLVSNLYEFIYKKKIAPPTFKFISKRLR